VDVLAVGGTSNHIHVLIALPSNRALADVMRDLKANSSLLLRENNRNFRWQDGYCAMSVSPRAVNSVIRYMANQEQHHAGASFETEYIAMLDRAGIEYAPGHVLDD
jgi:REP element-mobilizing transposase RayT